MSGGVDSSVTALLLKKQGYHVTGVYMKNWDASDELGKAACPHDAEFKDVEGVCKQLGIEAQQVNLVQSYWNAVFSPCLESFEEGLTPNPDILCNREIKFKAFLDYADKIGADFVATGHYAALKRATGSDEYPQLYAAKDDTKDQSYFLSNVAGKAFSKVLFPLGELRKSQVRQIALAEGLCTAEKKDSVGICFIGKRNFADFIHQYIPRQTGAFYTVDGDKMHDHDGFTSYTIGQGARIQGMSEKWFVVGKRKSDHAVIIAPGTRHPSLFTDSLFVVASEFNWIAGNWPAELLETGQMRCQYRVRYRQELGKCTISLVSRQEACENASTLHDWDDSNAEKSDGAQDENKAYLRVDFERPQRGVTPQQALVLYHDDGMCYGGGPITVAGKSYHEQQKPLDPNVYDWRSTQ
uniref:tRNA-5-taurinomethyluridine 2-sulfurtransferase n=1 Tax=Globisporangium ultimum (strain ATCC 200006 / CBS 805.95 / DAOM BR144) TaxID=431595 RepID=K3W542_GLOUD